MTDPFPTDRVPRIALLGEFSAGKSTLANALLGRTSSPVRVTATQVPPIWYHFGAGPPIRVDGDGCDHVLESTDLGHVPVGETRVVRVPVDAPFLRDFELIDMPGSSDPNMGLDIWEALLPEADLVLWCTPITQAWRQSEAAIWEDVPEHLQARSLLLLTRSDKVASAQDRARVVQRVERETSRLFAGVHAVSLLEALLPEQDRDRPDRSGLADVLQHLVTILRDMRAPSSAKSGETAANLRRSRADGGAQFASQPRPAPSRDEPARPAASTPQDRDPSGEGAESEAMPRPAGPNVLPRRVTSLGSAGTRRPRRATTQDDTLI